MDNQLSTALNKATPSHIAEAILTMRGTGISLYVHGAPGISKSSIARQVADQENIAFIDLRLSQLAPEDLRGVPVAGEVDGFKGIVWMPPMLFPRDLAYEGIETIGCDTHGTKVIRFFNPLGSNGIPYCTAPEITVTCLTSLVHCQVERRINGFTVQITNPQNGEPSTATIHWTVTGKVNAILGLEEFNSAPPSVMAAAYQLILDRRIGDYLVPDGVMLLAMGNRDSDRGVTHQLAKPVANRFVHLEMEFDFDDWFIWAGQHQVHPEVLGYLSKWKSKTNDFDPNSPHHAFATPRSWEFVSKIISRPQLPSNNTLRALICGAIGDAIGAEFMQHRKFMEDMPNIADILDGSVTEFHPSNKRFETQISYSICVQMCYELKKRDVLVIQEYHGVTADFNKSPARRKWLAEADHGFGYAIANFRPEVTIMACRLAIAVHKLRISPMHMPRLSEFLETYRDVIMERYT